MWVEDTTVYFQVVEMDESFRCTGYKKDLKLATPGHLLDIESAYSPELELWCIYLCGACRSSDLELSSHNFNNKLQALVYCLKVYESLQYFDTHWNIKDNAALRIGPDHYYDKERVRTVGRLQYRLWVDDDFVCFKMDDMDESFRLNDYGESCESHDFTASNGYKIGSVVNPQIAPDRLYLGGVNKKKDNKTVRSIHMTNEKAINFYEKVQSALIEFGKRND